MSTPYDNFAHGGLAAQVSDPATAEVQQLLQLLGYSPGAVDGIWGTKTQNALQALWMALGKMESPPGASSPKLIAELKGLVARGSVAPALRPPNSIAPPPASAVLDNGKPKWLSPTFIAVGALGLLGMGYLFWRESQGKMGDASASDAADPMDAVVSEQKVKKVKSESSDSVSPKSPIAPCPRSPNVDFDTGEPLAA